MKKLLLAILLSSSIANAAELSVDTLLEQGNTVSDGIQLSVKTGGTYYGWGTYSRHNEVRATQDIGKTQNYALGLGVRSDNGWFLELGATYIHHDTNERIAKEAIWYTFQPIFGPPPFSSSFMDVDYSYHSNTTYVVKIGKNIEFTEHFGVKVAYIFSSVRTTFAIWNPTLNGGPNWDSLNDDCGCIWVGSDKTKLNALEVGFKYKY